MEVMFWAEVVEAAAVAAGHAAEADSEADVLLEDSAEVVLHREDLLLEDHHIAFIKHRHRQDREEQYL
jgi:hypothetical protein